jgi:hypothetical protein
LLCTQHATRNSHSTATHVSLRHSLPSTLKKTSGVMRRYAALRGFLPASCHDHPQIRDWWGERPREPCFSGPSPVKIFSPRGGRKRAKAGKGSLAHLFGRCPPLTSRFNCQRNLVRHLVRHSAWHDGGSLFATAEPPAPTFGREPAPLFQHSLSHNILRP